MKRTSTGTIHEIRNHTHIKRNMFYSYLHVLIKHLKAVLILNIFNQQNTTYVCVFGFKTLYILNLNT